MTSKERLQATLNHRQPDRMVVDFSSTAVTGIHCKIIAELRQHYGLENRPIKIIEPFQMLGELDEELQAIVGIDCLPALGLKNMFNSTQTEYHLQRTPWGQEVLISKEIDLTPANDGNIYIHACGDRSYPPSAVMPQGCYFINAIEREKPIDDDNLRVEDNLEEFSTISEESLDHFARLAAQQSDSGKGVVASFGGTALGDIALVPGMDLKDPKGIRGVSEWYMSTVIRTDYIHSLFERQLDIAIENHRKLWERVGSNVDVVFTCGTDFGTQESQFCSVDAFRELWMPHYQRLNNWIHENTTWKVFKHSCGAILPLLPSFIEAGFDAINPLQINARGMNTQQIKEEFGAHLTFWGGGIDTQQILPHATTDGVRSHVLKQCETLNQSGGFVFNAVHNIQANAPIRNVVAMINAINEFRGITS